MGILKGDAKKWCGNLFQSSVLATLEEYDYEILDIRYIEQLKQVVITLRGVVVFATEKDVSLSFEISSVPEFVGNLCLILAERIPVEKIMLTDSFIITLNPKGEKMAVFGPDAKELYERDLVTHNYNSDYMKILTSPSIKFYEC